MPRKPKCCVCGEPAERLCDFDFGRFNGVTPTLDGPPHRATCDAPLCGRCAVQKGSPIFYCGVGGWVDFRDFCPYHEWLAGNETPGTYADRLDHTVTLAAVERLRKAARECSRSMGARPLLSLVSADGDGEGV